MIGPPVSRTSVAAREAVGGVHGDRAHAVVAEVLLHLADERACLAVRRRSVSVDLERVVDLGQLVVGKAASIDDAL